MPPEAPLPRVAVGPGIVHLVATASGLEAERARVEHALDGLRPAVVALGVSEDEVEALRHFLDEGSEQEVAEAEYDPGYAEGLMRFGEVSLPPPDLVAALGWAEAHGARVVGLDLAQHEYDRAFTQHVGTLEILMYGRRTRKLGKRPPEAGTAREFVIAWDRELRRSAGIAHVEALRERKMAERLAALAEDGAVVAAVLPASREEGVLAALMRRNGSPP